MRFRLPRSHGRGRRSLIGAGAALIIAHAAAAQAPTQSQGSATLVGLVTIKDAAVPLPYSVVSIAQPSREQFTDDRGQFRIVGLPAGPVRLRVRHVGYAPVDLDVVLRAGATDTVRVALTRIAVRLTTVQVRAYPECLNPGPPSSTDTVFTTVFGQLKQNAEQFRLLTHTYPFLYRVERTAMTVFGGIDLRRDHVDTLTLSSDNQWRYAPNTVVVEEPRGPGQPPAATMNIPTLANFADSLFVANHCFFNGGLETVDKEELLRVDFVAASALAEPDVDGAIFLDPATFQIRRSFLHLSRPLKAVADVTGTEVTTVFAELFPSVPVISTVSSVNHLRVNSRRYRPPTQTREQQQLIAVAFTGRKPGDDAKRP